MKLKPQPLDRMTVIGMTDLPGPLRRRPSAGGDDD